MQKVVKSEKKKKRPVNGESRGERERERERECASEEEVLKKGVKQLKSGKSAA